MIKERISQLRQLMVQNNIEVYYIHGSDPHLSEYLPQRWQTRSFISGFTGSAGWIAISLNSAALWTDSRYFLQAEQELEGTGIQLMKLREPETPSVTEWIINEVSTNSKIGIDASCIPVSLYKKMASELAFKSVELTDAGDLLDSIWNNRPAFPLEAIFEHDIKYTGKSRTDKIADIRTEMNKMDSDIFILSALDDIAWTFNLRGNDIEFNPVFLSYAIITDTEIVLFIRDQKLNSQLRKKLIDEHIQIKDYNEIFNYLRGLNQDTRILLDPDKTNQAIYESIPKHCQIKEELSIVTKLKAIKNPTEVANIKNAMKKDGVALVEFLYWIENNVASGEIIEYDLVEKVAELRAKQEGYKGESFFPIVGYKENGAVIHIRIKKDKSKVVKPEGIMLFDTGGHYLDGTTDITRTFALSSPTQQQKTDFTLVLKGLIALSLAKFPENTCGYHLDVLARKALWEYGQNYGHGTGHGVGFFLNVHEGPASIRMDYNPQSIKVGMVFSNEPGFYREGEYGIRIENLIVCVEKEKTEWGQFLGFETLTLCPIDTRMLNISMLTDNEIDWLNDYHQMVYSQLSQNLSSEHKQFLQIKTSPIKKG